MIVPAARSIRCSIVVALIAACGSATTPPPAAPVRPREDPAVVCGRVADALLGQFAARNGQPPPDKLAAAFRDLVIERCTQDVWPAKATDCMVAPNADLDACTALLTPQQQQLFQDDAQKKLAAAAVEQAETEKAP